MKATESVYEEMKGYQKDYPSLTFDNDGYEYLSSDVRREHKEQISEINKLLKTTLSGFVEFNNFKPRKNGAFAIRYQCYWDASFIGVGYINIEELK